MLETVLSDINRLFWGGPMLFLLGMTHLYFTLHLKFPFRQLPHAIRLSIGFPNSDSIRKNTEKNHFLSLATTLAATLGTGNIIGVSAAIRYGGPGAMFWCLFTGFFGMATTYAECYLSILYQKKQPDGTVKGGPMYVLEQGLKQRKTAILYAFATVMAAFFVGCFTQAGAFLDASETFGLHKLPTSLLLSFGVGLVILAGAKRIRNFCAILVPIMGGLYLFCCILILLRNLPYLVPALTLIFRSAFSVRAISVGTISGTLLTALRFGIARGLFTNEAGLGSAGIAAADTPDSTPTAQALVSMTATFWDTIVMCSLTGLAIITTLLADASLLDGLDANSLTNAAFLRLSPKGVPLLQLCLMAFAYATLIGWSYFGENAASYLFGIRGVKLYKYLYLGCIVISSLLSQGLIWELTDCINLCMALPNLLSLFLLRKKIQPPRT